MKVGILSTPVGLILLLLSMFITVTLLTTQTSNLEFLLNQTCNSTFAVYLPYCDKEIITADYRQTIDSVSALVCAVNSVEAKDMSPRTCPDAKIKGENKMCYGRTCAECDEFGGIKLIDLPNDETRAIEMIGRAILDCYRFVKADDNVYCAKLNTATLGREVVITEDEIDDWLIENGEYDGADIVGPEGRTGYRGRHPDGVDFPDRWFDTREIEWRVDAIKKDFMQERSGTIVHHEYPTTSNQIAILSWTFGNNRVWLEDAEPTRPSNIPRRIWEMRDDARKITPAYTTSEEAIREISRILLDCFQYYSLDEDKYCAEIDTSQFGDNVVVNERDITEWLNTYGDERGRDLTGEIGGSQLDWNLDTIRRNDPRTISIIHDTSWYNEVEVWSTYGFEITASEEPMMSCSVKDFDLPQEVSSTRDWIPFYGDPQFLVYWQVFPSEEDTWTAKRSYAIYMAIVVISIIPPLKTAKMIGSTAAKTLFGRIFKKMGTKVAKETAEEAVSTGLLRALRRAIKKSTNIKKPVKKAALKKLTRRNLREAMKDVMTSPRRLGGMSSDFAEAAAKDAPELAGKLAEKSSKKILGAVDELTMVSQEAKEKFMKEAAERATMEAAQYMGWKGLRFQFAQMIKSRIAGKELPKTILRMGIFTAAVLAYEVADNMLQVRYRLYPNKIVLKQALNKKAKVYDLKKEWPVLIRMPNAEGFYGLIPQVLSAKKTLNIVSPCHLKTMDVKKVIAQCGEFSYNRVNKTISCMGDVSIENDITPACFSYMRPDVDNPYQKEGEGAMTELVPHVRYIMELKEIPDEFRFIYDETYAVFPLNKNETIYYLNPEDMDLGSDKLVMNISDGPEVEILFSTASTGTKTGSSRRDSGIVQTTTTTITYDTKQGGNSEYGIEISGTYRTVGSRYTERTEFSSRRMGESVTRGHTYNGVEYAGKRFGTATLDIDFDRGSCNADSEVCDKLKVIDGIRLKFEVKEEQATVGGSEWGGEHTASAPILELSTGGDSYEGELPGGRIIYIDDDADRDVDIMQLKYTDADGNKKAMRLNDKYDEGEIESYTYENCRTDAVLVTNMEKAEVEGDNYCTRGKGTGTAWTQWGVRVASFAATVAAGFATGGVAWGVVVAATVVDTAVEFYAEEYMGKWPESW